MEDRIESLERRLIDLETRVDSISRRSRRRLMASALVGGLAMAWSATPEARAQFGLTLAGLNTRLTAVEAKTAPISVNGPDFSIIGKNVHVVDGSGSTTGASGLGNLTVGYNASRPGGSDARTGSHNLIVGDYNNYSSSGGLVAGNFNSIEGNYASVSGGEINTASGIAASVSGGEYNTASSQAASVSGGESNTASEFGASVSGGYNNTASGGDSTVGGGYNKSASGDVQNVP